MLKVMMLLRPVESADGNLFLRKILKKKEEHEKEKTRPNILVISGTSGKFAKKVCWIF